MPEDSSEIVREQSESVAATNLKTLGDGPSFYTNLAYGNAVSNQQSLNQISAAIISKAADMILNTSIQESGGPAALLQGLAKIAQTTPPQTGAALDAVQLAQLLAGALKPAE